jgi:hypothetical protein
MTTEHKTTMSAFLSRLRQKAFFFTQNIKNEFGWMQLTLSEKEQNFLYDSLIPSTT